MDIKLLHIHAQEQWHGEAFIVGNTEGLKTLRDAIDKALEAGHGVTPKEAGVFVTDGEGFDVHIVKNDDDWESESWNKAALPYTDEIAKGNTPHNDDQIIYPWDIIPEEYRTTIEEGPGLDEPRTD